MPSERQRILELALESLANKKGQIDQEIAQLTAELKRGRKAKGALPGARPSSLAKNAGRPGKRSRFSKEERARRSARMKAYWDKWRKDKSKQR